MRKAYVWPNDGRDWIDTKTAGGLLRIGTEYVAQWAREIGLEIWQPSGRGGRVLLLRSEVEEWAEIRRLRRQWYKKHDAFGGKRRTDKMPNAQAKEIYCDVHEAAAILGAPPRSVRGLVQSGRLVGYQSTPRQSGARLWFSRRAVEQIRDDPEFQKRRERLLRSMSSRALSSAEGKAKRERGAWLDKQGAFENRSLRTEAGLGGNWLNANEAAALMGLSVGRINRWRRMGRLEAVKIGWKPGHGRWHFREGDIREWMTRPDYLQLREKWENWGESERARREQEERQRERDIAEARRAERRREWGLGGMPSDGVW